MWETEARSSDGQVVSTHDAQAAAARVFEHVQLKGLSRAQVIQLLGDPERSNKSRYNFAFYPVAGQDGGVSDVLIYRFDTGRYGWQFNVRFREGRVSDVESIGIE
jgi:hypothetical protein